MDNSRSPYSDPYWNDGSFRSTEFPEASSTASDAGSGRGGGRAAHSDEEIILASNRPKKRAGRKKFQETRHPVYRGVRRRNNNRWVCELREPQKKSRIWLGTYPTAEMAARAHDVAAIALKGPSACLNFADSVWRLPVPASKDAKDIRRAAAEAAESFEAPAEVLKRLKVFDGGSSRNGTTEEEEREEEDVKEVMPKTSRSVRGYADEKAIFGMEELIESIAEGPLLSPSPCLNLGFCWDDAESTSDDVEISLWTY